MFCLLTRFSVPPYRGASRAPAVGVGSGDAAIVGSAVDSGGAVGAMAGCCCANAVGMGAVVGNGIVAVGNGIVAVGNGSVVGATADCAVGDAAAGAGLTGAGNASPSSEHATAAAAIATSVRIIRKE